MSRDVKDEAGAFDGVTAVILAGGKSRRMKTDKCLLPVDGRPMIEHVLHQLLPHFDQVLISSAEADRFSSLNVRVVADRALGLGPIMGIISSLEASRNDLNFFQACDIPRTDFALVQEMLNRAKGYDVVMPRTAEQRLEPLFAVYSKHALGALNTVLEKDEGRVYKIADRCHVNFVDLDAGYTIRNLNTMSDYRSFLHHRRGADSGD
jgi:molybdopterin-guanine dinucleotide biosynthesis protein A